MKKIFTSVMALCLLVLGSVAPVSAVGSLNSSEQAILDQLKSSVTVGSATVTLPAEYITAAENYMSKDGVDITDAQKATVVSNIESAKTYLKDNNITSVGAIKGDAASAIFNYINSAANAVGLKAQLNADKTIAILDAEGNVVFSGTAVVKKTGYDINSTALMGTGLVAVLLGVTLYAKKKKLISLIYEITS